MSLPTLYDAEIAVDQLVALEEGQELAPDEEAVLKEAIVQACSFAAAKRDRVANTITWLLAQAELAEAELKRLQKRSDSFRNAAERIKDYVLQVIQAKGVDEASGKLRRLQGDTTTMSAFKCPPSVEVDDPAAVPLKFKRVIATMPATIWNEIARVAPSLALAASVKFEVSKADIKITGHDVPGAKIVRDKLRLDIR